MVSLASPPSQNSIVLVDPALVKTEPATYQFRSGVDAEGITESGRYNTDQWNVVLHGNPILVHERKDGLFVADGHHRLDLAKRSNKTGHGPGRIAAIILREADGYSAEDVRVIAAYRNMRRGNVDPIDGARVFREVNSGRVHKELLPQLQMDKGNLTLSYKLSGLSDKALDKVAEQKIPVELAARVAEVVSDPVRQENIIGIIGYKLAQEYAFPEEFHATVSDYDAMPVNGFTSRLMKERANSSQMMR